MNNTNILNPFREKHTKYRTYINSNKNNISTTLDIKHKEKIAEFNNKNSNLIKKKKKYNKLIKELNDSKLNPNLNSNQDLQLEVDKLKLEISQLENRTEELDYYDETMDILLNYYSNDKQKLDDTNVININDIFKRKDVLVNPTDKSKLYDNYMKIVYNINTRKTKNSHIDTFIGITYL